MSRVMMALSAVAVVQSLGVPHANVGRRVAMRKLGTLSTLPLLAAASSPQPASALEDGLLPGELDFFIDPLRYATRKRTQQQKECYEADACADAVPYWDLVCERDDLECLARKRRLASSEWQNFFADPSSSPLLLFLAVAVAVQWGSALVRTASSVARKYGDGADGGENGGEQADED